jgi:hypothetical protein
MSLNDTMLALEAEIKTVIEDMKEIGLVPYFRKVKQGRLQHVDEFPSSFFWTEGEVPMGSDYLDGDLIKQNYTVAGYDFDLDIMGDYDLAEARSKKIGNDLRDEFSKWENRNLQGTVFQLQVGKVFIDPGVAPFQFADGGLMAAGGVELLVVYRQNRGS